MHPIDVSRAAALRSKDDPLAVSGERGVVIEGGIWQQRVLVGAVRLSDEQRGVRGPDTMNKNLFFRGQYGVIANANNVASKALLSMTTSASRRSLSLTRGMNGG